MGGGRLDITGKHTQIVLLCHIRAIIAQLLRGERRADAHGSKIRPTRMATQKSQIALEPILAAAMGG